MFWKFKLSWVKKFGTACYPKICYQDAMSMIADTPFSLLMFFRKPLSSLIFCKYMGSQRLWESWRTLISSRMWRSLRKQNNGSSIDSGLKYMMEQSYFTYLVLFMGGECLLLWHALFRALFCYVDWLFSLLLIWLGILNGRFTILQGSSLLWSFTLYLGELLIHMYWLIVLKMLLLLKEYASIKSVTEMLLFMAICEVAT